MAGGVSRAGVGGIEPQARPEAGRQEGFSFGGGGGPPRRSFPDAASSSAPPRAEAQPFDELARVHSRIVELERVIGRQQADLHFFREALRLWDAKRPTSGAPTSTKSSKK
jgi:hypothetical protein